MAGKKGKTPENRPVVTHPPQKQTGPSLTEMLGATKILQAFNHEQNMGLKEVKVKLKVDPVLIWELNDTHIGSLSTDHDALLKFVHAILERPDTAVILNGDLIEGVKQAYMRSNTLNIATGWTGQLQLLEEMLIKPLAEQGKIIAMVGHYFAHEGWMDAHGLNIWKQMAEKYNIPVIRNGGMVKLEFPNRHKKKIQVWHNTSRRSNLDVLHGVIKEKNRYAKRNVPDVLFSAHIHRGATGLEGSGPGSAVVIQGGTWKGTDEYPDPHGISGAMGSPDPGPQGVVMRSRTRQHEGTTYPIPSKKHGMMAVAAIELLNNTESGGETDELLGEIYELAGNPRISQRHNQSRLNHVYEEGPDKKQPSVLKKAGKLKNWEKLAYQIDTHLPILVSFVANARLGSKAGDGAVNRLEDYFIDPALDNPYRLMILLRQLIDPSIAKVTNRLGVLDATADLFNPVREQILALMLDSSLRRDGWKKSLGDELKDQPIPAGTYLSQAMDELPIIDIEGVLKLRVGQGGGAPKYTSQYIDSLGGRGTKDKATAGLFSVYTTPAIDTPGALIGGQRALPGFSTRHDEYNDETRWPHFIAPGVLADHIEQGGRKSQITKGKHTGSGIIYMPGTSKRDYLSFPVGSFSDGKTWHEALILLKGMELLAADRGIETKEMMKMVNGH